LAGLVGTFNWTRNPFICLLERLSVGLLPTLKLKPSVRNYSQTILEGRFRPDRSAQEDEPFMRITSLRTNLGTELSSLKNKSSYGPRIRNRS